MGLSALGAGKGSCVRGVARSDRTGTGRAVSEPLVHHGQYMRKKNRKTLAPAAGANVFSSGNPAGTGGEGPGHMGSGAGRYRTGQRKQRKIKREYVKVENTVLQ